MKGAWLQFINAKRSMLLRKKHLTSGLLRSIDYCLCFSAFVARGKVSFSLSSLAHNSSEGKAETLKRLKKYLSH